MTMLSDPHFFKADQATLDQHQNNPAGPGLPWVVIDLEGERYLVRRITVTLRRPRVSPDWCWLVATNWIEGHGWDTSAPIRRPDTLIRLAEELAQLYPLKPEASSL